MSAPATTLRCDELHVSFTVSTPLGQQTVDAVRGVSVAVARDRVLGIVGESGSGKSTLARSLVGLQQPTSGSVRCGELDVSDRSLATRRQLGRRVAMIFQDPRSSLNPRLSVRAVVADPLKVHGIGSRETRAATVERLLGDVGLPARLAGRRVRTLSGGQLQRVAIARALALEPDFIVADEPTSALDVSVQAQILNLLAELRRERQFGMLVISHDMRVMRFLCDDLVVMLAGEVVERGAAASIYAAPEHQYTRELIGATPLLGAPAAIG
jgi:peptide/nickel transport system ATP-binding protein